MFVVYVVSLEATLLLRLCGPLIFSWLDINLRADLYIMQQVVYIFPRSISSEIAKF